MAFRATSIKQRGSIRDCMNCRPASARYCFLTSHATSWLADWWLRRTRSMDPIVQVEPMGGLLHRIDGNQSAGQVQ